MLKPDLGEHDHAPLPRRTGTPRRRCSRPRRSGSTTARSDPAPARSSSSPWSGLLGYDFLEASAKARLANWATNLAALCVFVPHGDVLWGLGLAMGAANLVGGYLGARTAVAAGRRFVRVFFIVVVSAFIVRLGGELFGVW